MKTMKVEVSSVVSFMISGAAKDKSGSRCRPTPLFFHDGLRAQHADYGGTTVHCCS
jgi:hypothetical protein